VTSFMLCGAAEDRCCCCCLCCCCVVWLGTSCGGMDSSSLVFEFGNDDDDDDRCECCGALIASEGVSEFFGWTRLFPCKSTNDCQRVIGEVG